MNSSHPALNDPCPCGSGKKYGYCCLLKGDTSPLGSGAGGGIFADLHRELAGRTFGSLEEVQSVADAFTESRNRAAVDDFHGLSPAQMHGMLNFPFDTPQLVTFPECIASAPEAPILSLFALLADAIGEQGLKCTAKGNLPRAFCQEAAAIFRNSPDRLKLHRFNRINSELDYFDLHVTRLVAKEAGLIRKYKGRFKLTRECRSLLTGAGHAAIYPRLLRTFVQRYNWAYGDGYADLPFIQQSFLFTLYLLHRYGAEEKPHIFYEDAYIRAFPMLVEQVEPYPYSTPDQQVRNCYTLRALDRFAGFLGLAEMEYVSTDIPAREYQITKKPLLDQVVRFRL